MKKVVCFGEILMRFSPSEVSYEQQNMPFYIGGAELNVACALSKWQMLVSYCTAMPQGFLFENILNHITLKNIETQSINRSGDRMGIYYLQQGTDVKNAGVVFDRENSAFACLQTGMIDWHSVFKNADWFHFSAIAASLTQNAADVCIEALEVAKEMGLTISLDLNYRSKLWKYGKNPIEIMPKLVSYCDVLMGNLWSANMLLGIDTYLENQVETNTEKLKVAAQLSFQQIKRQYSNVKTIAYTFRFDTNYWAMMQSNDNLVVSKTKQIGDVVDKVGSGDCFMAGLIYGFKNNYSPQETIDFASTAAIGKLYENGDSTQQSVQQIKEKL